MCRSCYSDRDVRYQYPTLDGTGYQFDTEREPTMEELDALIAEQSKPENLPSWWYDRTEEEDDLIDAHENTPCNQGAANRNAVLNEEMVREILRRVTGGERQADVARSLSVSKWRVHEVVRRKRWKHVV